MKKPPATNKSQLLKTAGIADLKWLIGKGGAAWLEKLARTDLESVSLVAKLRRELSPEQTHLVLEQVALRRRARAKFDAADQMFFTSKGFEQSTDQWIARYKAARLIPGKEAGSESRVADLCCGIGGDLMSLAERADVVGVEKDPLTACLAEANLQTVENRTHTASVTVADADSFSLRDFDAWHIDPDRRPEGRRTIHTELFQPSMATIDRLLTECPNAAIKLAPATPTPDEWSRVAEREWISRNGECRQQIAWFGRAVEAPGKRRASILKKPWRVPEDLSTFVGEGDLPIPTTGKLNTYLYEPDPSVLAARLIGAIAEHFAIAALNPSVAYLTGDRLIDEPLLGAYEVRETLPFHEKQLKRRLRELKLGHVEVKKRGVAIDANEWERRFRSKAPGRAVLFVFPIGEHITAVLADRVKRS